MSEDMHGARRSHEIYGVSLDLALQIEEAEEIDETKAGMSSDKNKSLTYSKTKSYPACGA